MARIPLYVASFSSPCQTNSVDNFYRLGLFKFALVTFLSLGAIIHVLHKLVAEISVVLLEFIILLLLDGIIQVLLLLHAHFIRRRPIVPSRVVHCVSL